MEWWNGGENFDACWWKLPASPDINTNWAYIYNSRNVLIRKEKYIKYQNKDVYENILKSKKREIPGSKA